MHGIQGGHGVREGKDRRRSPGRYLACSSSKYGGVHLDVVIVVVTLGLGVIPFQLPRSVRPPHRKGRLHAQKLRLRRSLK